MSVSKSSFLKSGLGDTETSRDTMSSINNMFTNLSSSVNDIGNNEVFNSVIVIILVLYITLAAPKLPKSIAVIFDSPFVKLLYLFLIGYLASKNPAVSLIVAVMLLVTIQTLTYAEQGGNLFSLTNFCQDTSSKQTETESKQTESKQTETESKQTETETKQTESKQTESKQTESKQTEETDCVFIINNDNKPEDKTTQDLYKKMDKIAVDINKKTVNQMMKEIKENFTDIEIKGINMTNTVNSTTDSSADMSSVTMLQLSGDSLRISKDYAKKYKKAQEKKGVEGFDNISKQLLINTINNHIKAISHIRIYILSKQYNLNPSDDVQNKINNEEYKINLINKIEEYIKEATYALDKNDSNKLHMCLAKAQNNNKEIQEIIKKEILPETNSVLVSQEMENKPIQRNENIIIGDTADASINYASVPSQTKFSPVQQQKVNYMEIPMFQQQKVNYTDSLVQQEKQEKPMYMEIPMFQQQKVNYAELPVQRDKQVYMESPIFQQQKVNYAESPVQQERQVYMESPIFQQQKVNYAESPVQQENTMYVESPIYQETRVPVPLGMLNKQSEGFADVSPTISQRSANSEMNTLTKLPNDMSYCVKQNDNPSKDYLRAPAQCSIDNTCKLTDNTSVNAYMTNNVEYGMV